MDGDGAESSRKPPEDTDALPAPGKRTWDEEGDLRAGHHRTVVSKATPAESVDGRASSLHVHEDLSLEEEAAFWRAVRQRATRLLAENEVFRRFEARHELLRRGGQMAAAASSLSSSGGLRSVEEMGQYWVARRAGTEARVQADAQDGEMGRDGGAVLTDEGGHNEEEDRDDEKGSDDDKAPNDEEERQDSHTPQNTATQPNEEVDKR